MVRSSALIKGIGNVKTTRKYYDQWSSRYDITLNEWNYKVPKKSVILLKTRLKYSPKNVLDLACGTGLFGEELKKIFSKSKIFGLDISQKSLEIAKNKNIYSDLFKINFENRKNYKIKFDLVSMIGAMTYCKNFNKLFSNLEYYLSKKGYFIFSHRTDLWEKQKFDNILLEYKDKFTINLISRPQNYLPLNKDFKNKIKIRLVLLQKS